MNKLAAETSLYLLQHAKNPINWNAWSDAIFDIAKSENKLVLISIGYSACHWCHVMEKECFEDEELAAFMNDNFICIKVDREERPDIDQVYMSALQLMTQKGGWPLNCFTLPDGRPIYGGTYFPKEQWLHILKSLVHSYRHDFEKVVEYAKNLNEAISQSELIDLPQKIEKRDAKKLHEIIDRWSPNFDNRDGGPTKAPKFPLPNNYLFLMEFSLCFKDKKVQNHVLLTLDKMLAGGIYDQIGGGFSRYSVDMLWKVPHFEKMLYDNAQLLELYSNAYKYYKKNEYKEMVYQTVDWLEREMKDSSNAFYSALDADTDNEEGKFYCWQKKELKTILGEDFSWFSSYYSVNKLGFWEDNKYILLRTETAKTFARSQNWTLSEFQKKRNAVNKKLLAHRNKRTQPGCDTKCLTSWNAMTISGFCAAFSAFGDIKFLNLAKKTALWIENYQLKNQDCLYHNFANNKACIDGFLEDYAFVIEAFIRLYQVSAELKWLNIAQNLAKKVERDFMHQKSKMCYFSDNTSTLIARKMDIYDNVIPASNSVMANNFYLLGHYYKNIEWQEIANQMLANVYDGMEQYGSGFSNWGLLLLRMINGLTEINSIGKNTINSDSISTILNQYTLVSYHQELPISKEYKNDGVYVCTKGICHPVISEYSKLKVLLDKNSY